LTLRFVFVNLIENFFVPFFGHPLEEDNLKALWASSVAAGIWGLLSQLPTNEFVAVVILGAVLMMIVLFHEPACSRLIRIIKAFTEVRQPKTH
jgi:hypothetical protein